MLYTEDKVYFIDLKKGIAAFVHFLAVFWAIVEFAGFVTVLK